MKIALITIGDELLSGFTVNTNAAWIGKQVITAGGTVSWHQTISDTKAEIHQSLANIPNDIETVIITGGLGPTHDDVTANALYEYTGDSAIFDNEYWQLLQNILAKRNLKLPEINRNQAMKPKEGSIISNPVGSARGLHFHFKGKDLFALPGVPKEMKAMMSSYILPWISDQSDGGYTIKTIRTTGIMESGLAEKLDPLITDLDDDIKVAFLPQFIGVDVRISCQNSKKMMITIDNMKEIVGKYIYGTDDQDIAEIVGSLLNEKGLTLATAESCTGGLVGHRITGISGSSNYYTGSIVSYSNDVKENSLNVAHDTLMDHGAVSSETAMEMAENIRAIMKTDLGLSITGIAGPSGGTKEKPVGLTYIALADGSETRVKEFRFFRDRELNKKTSSQAALNMVRLYLINE